MSERYRGYADGLKSSGLPFDPRLVKQGFNTFQSGVECGRELLRQEERPTAVFASNDEMAIGFDDIPIGQQIFPALTTIRQPVETMAMTATDLLLGQLRGVAPASARTVLESVIQLRESTGPGPHGH